MVNQTTRVLWQLTHDPIKFSCLIETVIGQSFSFSVYCYLTGQKNQNPTTHVHVLDD